MKFKKKSKIANNILLRMVNINLHCMPQCGWTQIQVDDDNDEDNDDNDEDEMQSPL